MSSSPTKQTNQGPSQKAPGPSGIYHNALGKTEAAALAQKKQNERKQYYEQQDQKTAIAKQREDRKWPTQVEKANALGESGSSAFLERLLSQTHQARGFYWIRLGQKRPQKHWTFTDQRR